VDHHDGMVHQVELEQHLHNGRRNGARHVIECNRHGVYLVDKMERRFALVLRQGARKIALWIFVEPFDGIRHTPFNTALWHW
jgi:hypothetical protein